MIPKKIKVAILISPGNNLIILKIWHAVVVYKLNTYFFHGTVVLYNKRHRFI